MEFIIDWGLCERFGRRFENLCEEEVLLILFYL